MNRKRVIWILPGLALAALLAWAFVPKAVEVDAGAVTVGPMQVTVDQEGKTQVKDRYVVAAPLAGELERIALKAGDAVEARKTVLARVEPTPPALLDFRAREEAEARVRASEAAVERARPDIARGEAEVTHGAEQFRRARQMAAAGVASPQEVEDKELVLRQSEANLRTARSAQAVAQFELDQAKAALLRVMPAASTRPAPFEVFSPIDGQVLRVLQESAAPVTAGTQLLEVGDVRRLEAVIDVLSRDAVKIHPGAKVLLDRWGGEQPLKGTVRRVEPSGFTKVSALGVEEQRVNVIVDFELPEAQRLIGDAFRVDARIVVWERAQVLQAPAGALFRQGEDWAVYRLERGRAVRRVIRIGRMSGLQAEVLEGLAPGDQVVLHPSDKVHDGVRVEIRTAAR